MKVVVTKSRMRGLVQEDKVCSTHCIASFSPRCDSFTRFDGSVRLHRGEPVSEGVHHCAPCESPRQDEDRKFCNRVFLHARLLQFVPHGDEDPVRINLLWFSVNERYLRQLKEDLRKELIACGFRPRRAGEWIVSPTKARRTRMRTL